MKREDLLSLIERANRVEEDAIDNLTAHIKSAIRWTGMSEDENRRVLEGLQKLNEDSGVHYQLLQDLHAWVIAQKKDTF